MYRLVRKCPVAVVSNKLVGFTFYLSMKNFWYTFLVELNIFFLFKIFLVKYCVVKVENIFDFYLVTIFFVLCGKAPLLFVK